MIDDDKHYDEICGYLATMSKEDTIKLGVALGLKDTRLKEENGKSPMICTISVSWY